MADEKDLNEQKQTVDEKTRNEQQPVAEEDMEQVAGGSAYGRIPGALNPAVRWDSKGNATHWRDIHGLERGKVYCFLCPHCGRLLHEGLFARLYCDPCDESWFGCSLTKWYE